LYWSHVLFELAGKFITEKNEYGSTHLSVKHVVFCIFVDKLLVFRLSAKQFGLVLVRVFTYSQTERLSQLGRLSHRLRNRRESGGTRQENENDRFHHGLQDLLPFRTASVQTTDGNVLEYPDAPHFSSPHL
jgi:hypothetical protein